MLRTLPRKRIVGREGGLALIAVLWLVALLTVMALSAVAVTSRVRDRQASAFALRSAELRADGALRTVMVELLQGPEGRGLQAPATRGVALGSERLAVSVSLERERLDLNTAAPAALLAHFTAQGAPSVNAQTLVARLQDWVDVDDVPRAGGAERAQYVAATRRVIPRNGPLETVEELRQIWGAENVDVAALEGLTVYTHAPVAVPRSAASGLGSSWRGELLRLTACAAVPDASSVCRRAIVRLTGHTDAPWQVFAWRTQYGTAAAP